MVTAMSKWGSYLYVMWPCGPGFSSFPQDPLQKSNYHLERIDCRGKNTSTFEKMAWNSMLMLSVLCWLPSALALPNRISARATGGPPIRSHSTSAIHTSFTGTPTVVGALNATSVGTGISSLGVAPGATTYPSDGKLHQPQPAPFVPGGGLGTNGTTPVYNAKSDFDYQSLVCESLRCCWRDS